MSYAPVIPKQYNVPARYPTDLIKELKNNNNEIQPTPTENKTQPKPTESEVCVNDSDEKITEEEEE